MLLPSLRLRIFASNLPTNLLDNAPDVLHSLFVWHQAKVPPASLLKEQAGAQISQRFVTTVVGNFRTFCERSVMLVAAEHQRELANRLPIRII